MPLDDQSPIPPLQSSTIKASLMAVIVNALALVTIFTGKAYDITMIQHYVDLGVPMGVNFLTMYLSWKAIKGRTNATQTIQKKEQL